VEHRTLVAERPRTPATQPPNAVPHVAPSSAGTIPAATTGAATSPAQQTPGQSVPTAVSQAATTAAAPAPPAAAPIIHDSAAATNAQVLEELRSIRSEIEARKKHVDSLTHALDSLKKVDQP
ncbi:MAG TPA: hypothetical protein VJO52_15525, partial [Gemmatimonadaceae bacterium]|nr:hypothetical protein [Gemmatimonadaceae bacterium]